MAQIRIFEERASRKHAQSVQILIVGHSTAGVNSLHSPLQAASDNLCNTNCESYHRITAL